MENSKEFVTGSEYGKAIGEVFEVVPTVAQKAVIDEVKAETRTHPGKISKTTDIPVVLQPTIFVLKPGVKTPVLDKIRIIHGEAPEDKNQFYITLSASVCLFEREFMVARHFSVYTKGLRSGGEDDSWRPFKENYFVIGWEHTTTKDLFKEFIKGLINKIESDG